MKKQLFSFLLALFFALNLSAQSKGARKTEELNSLYNCEDLQLRLDAFVVHLQNEPKARGYLFVYEGKYSQYVYDRKGNSKVKTYLPTFAEANLRTQVIFNHFKFRGFPIDRILLISGGYREEHSIEFWIVPNGAKPPKPSPTLDEIKYRKGKPLVFCSPIG